MPALQFLPAGGSTRYRRGGSAAGPRAHLELRAQTVEETVSVGAVALGQIGLAAAGLVLERRYRRAGLIERTEIGRHPYRLGEAADLAAPMVPPKTIGSLGYALALIGNRGLGSELMEFLEDLTWLKATM